MRHVITRVVLAGLLATGTLVVTATTLGVLFSNGDAHPHPETAGGSAYLGVVMQSLTPELKDSYGYNASGGILISDLDDGGPADKAGIRQGDILIRFKGSAIESGSDLRDRLRSSEAGESATVVVWRDGRERTFRVELGSKPDFRGRRLVVPDADIHIEGLEDLELDMDDLEMEMGDLGDYIRIAMSGRGVLGIQTQDLNKQLGSYFEVPSGEGVLVLEVLEDTPAEKAGLRAGDVIVSVDGESVSKTSELRSELAEADEGPVELVVVRSGSEYTITAELEKRQHRGYSYRYHTDRDHGWHRAPYVQRRQTSRELDREMEELRRELRELQRELDQLRRDSN